MLKSKSELENKCLNVCKRTIILDKEKCEQLQKILFEKFEIPMGLTMDMVAQRISLSEESEFVLFCLSYGLDEITTRNKIVKNFFTENEIKTYSNEKYYIERLSFPIRIKCIAVSQDQWVGAIDSKFLMGLRRSQLINYNTNAQRTMTKIVKGDTEYYKISINESAVEKIKKSLEDNIFIPNTISLNIPLDSESNFYYDEKNCELIISSLEYFDITDGYHRYIAMCRASDLNPEFNYPMEVRITNFEENKSKQFIFQEDQKTQMSKTDSNSMNMNNPANIVLERLNQDIMFDLKGEVNRSGGVIPFIDMSVIVSYFYFKKYKKSEERMLIRNAEAELRDIFNYIVTKEEFSNEKLDFCTLCVIIMAFKYRNGNYNDIEKLIVDTINEVKEDQYLYSKIKKRELYQSVESKVLEIMRGVDQNV